MVTLIDDGATETQPRSTIAPVRSLAFGTARIITFEDPTEFELSEPALRCALVAQDLDEPLATDDEQDPHDSLEEDVESGAPSAALLLTAVSELTAWLVIQQKDLCGYLDISPSTVMAWKRDKRVHPRHARIPALLRMWAAVSGAVEEFGEERTHRLVGPHRTARGFDLPPDNLSALLLDAARAASLEALEDTGYVPGSARATAVDEIEQGERELSESLKTYLEGLGADDA